MTTIKELFPKPNISVNERALRPLIYGFECKVFEDDQYQECFAFLNPDTFSMLDIVLKKTGKLYSRINLFDVVGVR